MKLFDDPLWIGLLVQGAGAIALATICALLHLRLRRATLLYWAASWAALGLALLALLTAQTEPALTYAGQAAYVFLEALFGLLLVAGCRQHVHGIALPRHGLLWLVPAAALALALPAWAHGHFSRLFIPQSAVLAGFLFAAFVVLSRARPREGVGHALTLTALGLLTLDFVQYVPIFARSAALGAPLPQTYLRFTSLFHLLLEFLLGMGGVLLVAERRDHELERHNRELAQARAQLASLARVDALTGAFNRHAFQELTRTAAREGAGAVAMVDLDGLKAVNDLYGHAAGDALIAGAAAAIRARLRAEDALFRWGGDEFLVLAVGLGTVELERRFAGVGQELGRVALPGLGAPLRVTACVGCAAFAAPGEIEGAVARADAAMYARKAARARRGGPARPLGFDDSLPARP